MCVSHSQHILIGTFQVLCSHTRQVAMELGSQFLKVILSRNFLEQLHILSLKKKNYPGAAPQLKKKRKKKKKNVIDAAEAFTLHPSLFISLFLPSGSNHDPGFICMDFFILLYVGVPPFGNKPYCPVRL